MRLAHLAALWLAAGVPAVASGQPAATQHYALVEGSTFQRGCFDPCACPISVEQPLSGSFALAPVSDNGLFADYAMDDVHWKVQGAVYATPPNAEITGSGSYTVGGEFAIQQQMTAELAVAGEPPARFDSGRVTGGSSFPNQIDIEISKNGKVCFDTVIHVVAKAVDSDCDPKVTYCPEPNSTALLAVGAFGLALLHRRRGTR